MSIQWHEKFESLEEEKNQEAEVLIASLLVLFTDTLSDIKKHLSSWFGKFGDKLTVQDARRVLTKQELIDFRKSIKSFLGEDLDPKFLKDLEKISTRVRVSRLDSLELQIQCELEKLFASYSDKLDDFLETLYVDQHNRTLYEIAVGLKRSKVFRRVDPDKLKQLLGTAWSVDEKTYSSRIWDNKTKLVNEFNNIIEGGLIRGDGYREMSSELAKRMNVSFKNADRLIKTEAAYVFSEAQKESYLKFGVEEYEFVATLDHRTSEVCRYMDGKVIPVSEMKVGLNAPPLHPRCRSTTVPYFEDEETTRAARNQDGEYIQVSSKMTYMEWEKTFLR